MKQRRGLVLVLLVAACLIGLACVTCGVGTWWVYKSGWVQSWLQSGSERPPLSGPARRAQTTPTAPAKASPESARPGGELRLTGAPPATLDPALVQDSFSSTYIVEIFSGLVTLDRNLDVAPDLAERWEVSPDGRTYTFYLRRDAKFHNGRPVMAADFKYSLERACSPGLASPVAATYLGDIEGALAVIRGQAKEISGVQVLDDYRLSLTIDAPKAYFLSKLTYPTAFVVDRTNVESGARWTERPNGTGPFRLVQRDQQRIVLERNEHYCRGPARLQRVVFVLSGGLPSAMYENGQLDIIEVGLIDLERVQDPNNPLNRELTVVPRFDVQYLGMNTRMAPFDDVKVRQAFAHAIDRQRLANTVWRKAVVAAEGVLPPGFPGYSEDLRGLAFDPALARQRLQESKYKDAADLPEIVLHTSGSGGTLSPTVEAIVAMLRTNLGVDVKVVQTPWERFLTDLNEQRYPFFTTGWIADYPDPQNFLDILFHSGSGDNHTGYANPQVDRLLEQARLEPDEAQRMRLYQQAEALIVEEAPWVPLWHGRDYILTKPYVKGAVFSAAIRPWLKDVYLER